VLAVERYALPVEEPTQHDCALLELVEAILDRQERHPERAELMLVPAGAESDLRPPAAQMVDRHGGLTEHARVAVPDAEDEAADADAGRRGGECRHRRDALERRSRRVGEVGDRVEVVPDRAPVEAGVVGEPPEPAELVEAAVLWPRVDPEAHARSLTTRAGTRLGA